MSGQEGKAVGGGRKGRTAWSDGKGCRGDGKSLLTGTEFLGDEMS